MKAFGILLFLSPAMLAFTFTFVPAGDIAVVEDNDCSYAYIMSPVATSDVCSLDCGYFGYQEYCYYNTTQCCVCGSSTSCPCPGNVCKFSLTEDDLVTNSEA